MPVKATVKDGCDKHKLYLYLEIYLKIFFLLI